jgi:hypothetical protein
MTLTPLLSSIGDCTGIEPQPSDREPSTLPLPLFRRTEPFLVPLPSKTYQAFQEFHPVLEFRPDRFDQELRQGPVLRVDHPVHRDLANLL